MARKCMLPRMWSQLPCMNMAVSQLIPHDSGAWQLPASAHDREPSGVKFVGERQHRELLLADQPLHAHEAAVGCDCEHEVGEIGAPGTRPAVAPDRASVVMTGARAVGEDDRRADDRPRETAVL